MSPDAQEPASGSDAGPAPPVDPAVVDGSIWEKILGTKLTRHAAGKDLELVDTAEALRGKHVGLYFSAHWCV
jgi:hypothetical protein